ncbi:MAG: glucose-1-phosphate cytidylyltransferase [Alteromonas naphthalenivorans]|jgi:glucose-1-phosphate cytidylyltransferase
MGAIKKSDIPVVILAGGLGTRLREETEFRPKPMVTIGGRPILWHIMKLYSYFGFNKFIICLGYKGEMIKEYFFKYRLQDLDFTINTKTGLLTESSIKKEEWEVTLVNTGDTNQTGSRVAQIADYIKTDTFMLTYGDGIANVDIKKLIDFHFSHNKIATLTGVYPPTRFGHLKLNENKVESFLEKQRFATSWINGGFFVLNKKVLDLVSKNESCIFEKDVLPILCDTDELMAYKHTDFWYCMDTIRDKEHLESLWKNNAPWKVWQDDSNYYRTQSIKSAGELVL